MSKPRGPSGTVRGLKPKQVDKFVLAYVQSAMSDLNGNSRGRFRRLHAKEWFMEQFGVTDHQADGLVDQLELLPGVIGEGGGWHTLPADAVELAKHRRWRLPSGRLGVADAKLLVTLLDGHYPQLTPRLLQLLERAQTGLKHIKV